MRYYFAKRFRIPPKLGFNEHQAAVIGYEEVVDRAFTAPNIGRYFASEGEKIANARKKIANRQYAWLFIDQFLKQAFVIIRCTVILHPHSGEWFESGVLVIPR